MKVCRENGRAAGFIPAGASPAARLRQHLHFLVERQQQLTGGQLVQRIGRAIGGRPLAATRLVPPAAAPGPQGVQGHLTRHPVQPARKALRGTNGTHLPGEHEPGGLEGVLSIFGVAQHAAADAQDQSAVPMHQRGERLLVPLGDEAAEQLSV